MSEESPIDDYIQKTEVLIKHLKDKKIEDRLDSVSLIEEAVNSINASIVGWSAWLQHPSIMKSFNKDELLEISEGFRKLSIEFLEFDIKWTKVLQARKEAERADKQKEKETEKRQTKHSEKQYIS